MLKVLLEALLTTQPHQALQKTGTTELLLKTGLFGLGQRGWWRHLYVSNAPMQRFSLPIGFSPTPVRMYWLCSLSIRLFCMTVPGSMISRLLSADRHGIQTYHVESLMIPRPRTAPGLRKRSGLRKRRCIDRKGATKAIVGE